MVVRDLDLVGVSFPPLETNAVLVIHANAVLAFPIAPQPLQPVAGRQSQVAERAGSVQHLQFLERSFP